LSTSFTAIALWWITIDPFSQGAALGAGHDQNI
jgi:hypothetical protein